MLLTYLPAGSATDRLRLGEVAEWGLVEQLQAATLDALRVANWQRSGKGPAPKPLPRPGVGLSGVTIGKSARSPEQTRAFLDKFKPEGVDSGE